MGRVGWTVGWFLPVVPHPVVVWEVVVNTDCEMWSHQDGFPGGVRNGGEKSSKGGMDTDRGVVPSGRTTPRGRVGGRGQHRL